MRKSIHRAVKPMSGDIRRRIAAMATAGALVAGLSATTVGALPAAAAPVAGRTESYPYAVSNVKATPGTAKNTVVVTWSGGGRATGVGVIAGGESTTKIDHFRTKWYAPGTHRVVVTVPSALRYRLGVNTGNYVFVRVVQTNSTAKNPVMHLAASVADAYRISKLAASALVGGSLSIKTGTSHITVGELNTQSITATAGFSFLNRWSSRAPRLTKTIVASHPDVFTTAELETHKLDSGCANHITHNTYCATQASDLAKRLKASKIHYAWATSDSYKTVLKRTAADTKWQGKVTEGAQIFYNPAKISLVSHGYVSPAMDLHVKGWTPSSGVQDRWWAWAVLKVKSSGKEFVAVAAHYTAVTSKKIQTFNDIEAAKASKWIGGAAAFKALPVVVAGDFNADPIRDANPNSRIMLQAGFRDAAATTNRTGARYETFNGENGTGGLDYGYPVTAIPHRYNTSRIDFVLLKGAVYSYSYANVLHVQDGLFQRSYQGTDHNLQLAHLGIG